ncbi:MAG TPA: hypothetical protein VFV33_01925, partial [Gemmatimonadaceae bacterium]|nr:hypothetical protein [Gemmatimonadaceae bacterium]
MLARLYPPPILQHPHAALLPPPPVPMFVPSMLLKQLYTFGSLKNSDEGVVFTLKNRLADAQLTGLRGIRINGEEVPLHDLELRLDDAPLLS